MKKNKCIAFVLSLTLAFSYIPTIPIQASSVNEGSPIYSNNSNDITSKTTYGYIPSIISYRPLNDTVIMSDSRIGVNTGGDSQLVLPPTYVKAGTDKSAFQPILYGDGKKYYFYYGLAEGRHSVCASPRITGYAKINANNNNKGYLSTNVGYNVAVSTALHSKYNDNGSAASFDYFYVARLIAVYGQGVNKYAGASTSDIQKNVVSTHLTEYGNNQITTALNDITSKYTYKNATGDDGYYVLPVAIHDPSTSVKNTGIIKGSGYTDYIYDITDLTRSLGFWAGSLQPSLQNQNGETLTAIDRLDVATQDWSGKTEILLMDKSHPSFESSRSKLIFRKYNGAVYTGAKELDGTFRAYQVFHNDVTGAPDIGDYWSKLIMLYDAAGKDTQAVAQLTSTAIPIFLEAPKGNDEVIYSFGEITEGKITDNNPTIGHITTDQPTNTDLKTYEFESTIVRDGVTYNAYKWSLADTSYSENYKYNASTPYSNLADKAYNTPMYEKLDDRYWDEYSEDWIMPPDNHSGKGLPPDMSSFRRLYEDPETMIILYLRENDKVEKKDPNPTYTELKWNSIPLAYGELKEGTYSDNRSTETWEAMNGTPETETLYYNGGGSAGAIDVSYGHVTNNQQFSLSVSSSSSCAGHEVSDGKGGTKIVYRASHQWSKTSNPTYMTEVEFLHFDNTTLSTAKEMLLSNLLLKDNNITIKPSSTVSSSVKVTPNTGGLSQGPGAGSSTFNFGTENKWYTSHTYNPPQHTCKTISQHQSDVQTGINQANGIAGNIFAQNDQTVYDINGQELTVVDKGINKQTAKPYGSNNILIAGTPIDFTPTSTNSWSTYSKIHLIGYAGEPDVATRNKGNITWIKENLKIDERLTNGLYDFEEYAVNNYMEYSQQHIKGPDSSQDTNPLKSEYEDDRVTDASMHKSTDTKIRVEYLNWQYEPATKFDKPDKVNNILTTFTEGRKTNKYFSVNPIIIHNPVTANYPHIYDITDKTLFDQRISEGTLEVDKRHNSALDSKTASRLYIDQDFKITIPNKGSLSTYWTNPKALETDKGLIDQDFDTAQAIVGTRGNSYTGVALANIKDRNSSYPYDLSSQLDTSKWINAKWIKFPFDVIYYRDDKIAETHNANTWIKLYDDGRQTKINDKTDFYFKVASNVTDKQNQSIEFIVESINADGTVQGQPEKLFADAETYANGNRNKTYAGSKGLSAASSAKFKSDINNSIQGNQAVVDVIGRIGNLIVSSSTDPAFSNVFWNTDEKGNLITSQAKSGGYYSTKSNIFQTDKPSNKFINRFMDLEYLVGNGSNYTLPVGVNPLPDKNKQYMKMGYEVQGSLQTIGDHKGTIDIYPFYSLSGGGFDTGKPFKLTALDTLGTNKDYLEFYNSINNTVPKAENYTPKLDYNLYASLINPRSKISTLEKTNSNNYKTAFDKGSNYKVNTGTLSKITIPTELSTNIGTTNSKSTGYQGLSPLTNNRIETSTANTAQAIANVNKWHFTLGLPQNTKVIIDDKIIPNSSNQRINTSLVSITRGGTALWDLVISQESLVSSNSGDGEPDVPPTPEVPSKTVRPKIELITVDYANTSSSDKTTIGTQ